MKAMGCVALLCLAACSSDVERAKGEVRDSLANSQLAFFKNVRLLRSGIVCGEVNGTDRFGYYSGFAPFVAKATGDGFEVTVLEGRLPTHPVAADYPAEELAECFPQLAPALRLCLSQRSRSQSTDLKTPRPK